MASHSLKAIDVPFPNRPFHHFIESAALRFPERIALRFADERYTYRELDALANSFANALRELGICAGDRTAICLTNRPEWIIAFYGISKLGAAAVIMSSAWKEGEIRHALDLTQPAAVVGDGPGMSSPGFAGVPVKIAADAAPPGWHSFWGVIERASAEPLAELDVDLATAELALPFSSGTTGLPKAVRHSHRSLVAGTVQWKTSLQLDEHDAIQVYTPMAHILGIVNTSAAIAAGAPVRLFKRFELERVLQSIQDDHITVGIAVGPIAAAMADFPDLERYDLGSLRYFNWSATPVVERVATKFTDRTGVRWLQGYGATESLVMFANPVKYPDEWRLDSPGVAVAGVEAQIVDPSTLEPVPPGQSGELIVRNPSTALGYLPDSADREVFLPDGWYRTGDIGWMEPEGWLHITDRLREMIKVSGFQVAPAEVEGVLRQHPDIADCAVFGIDDESKGQVPHAAIVLWPGSRLEEQEIKQWMDVRLAGYKKLAAVHLVEEIPRTASGKVLRRILKAEFSGLPIPVSLPR